jgi:hypothetical protein
VTHALGLGVATLTFNEVIMVFAVVALEEGYIATVFISQNMCGNTIEKPSVVGYH